MSGIAEAQLGLHGVHVHIHRIGRHLQEQRRDRMPALGHHVPKGHAQGGAQHRITHRAAIDDQMLLAGGGAGEAGLADQPGNADAVVAMPHFPPHRQCGGGETVAQHRPDPGVAALRRQLQPDATIAHHVERHLWPGKGEAAEHVQRLVGLIARGAQEFAACRGGEEKIRDLDPGAGRRAGGRDGPDAAALHRDGMGIGTCGTRGDGQPRHRADGGQRFAPEAQRGDGEQCRFIGQFGGGVALHRQSKAGGVHAHAVILDDDALDAAAFQRDADAPGAGVQRVLHQLLHHGGRPLDHFAGGDAVGGGLRQDADRVGHAGRIGRQ